MTTAELAALNGLAYHTSCMRTSRASLRLSPKFERSADTVEFEQPSK
jgi:hypothetical protein